MKVIDLMVRSVITCKENDPVGEAAKLMWENDIGFLPVLDSGGAMAGVITDRDGFIAAYFQGKSVWDIPVRAAMSTRVTSVPPDADLEEAEEKMRNFQVHRLPVLGPDHALLGVISLNDIAREAARDADEDLEEEVAVTLDAIAQPRGTH